MPLGRQVPQARERPGGQGSLKILLDEDTGKVFAQRLTELLEPEGATVFRSVKVGWRGAKNGDLLTMAANNGYTHLVTADKMMAEETRRPSPFWWSIRWTTPPRIEYAARPARLLCCCSRTPRKWRGTTRCLWTGTNRQNGLGA